MELRSEAASSLKLPGFYHENVCELHAEAGLNEGTPEALLTRGIVFLRSQAVQRILQLGSFSPTREIGAKRQIAIVAVRANNLPSQKCHSRWPCFDHLLLFQYFARLAPAMLHS